MSLAKGVPYVNYFQADGRVTYVFGAGCPLCKLFQGQTAGSLMSLVKGVPYVNYFQVRRKGH